MSKTKVLQFRKGSKGSERLWGDRKDSMNNTQENRMQWHPACFAALNLEFLENKEELEFLREQSINELPLRVDALIIKKTKNCIIKNEIGEIFRWYNLVEYKSPDDELSFNTFLKGIAEVYLYKVKQGQTRIDSYSLSFIRARKPFALFTVLERYGFIIEEKYPGIYYIAGRNIFPIQIVVSSRLNMEAHLWLNSLSKNLSIEQAKKLLTTTNHLWDIRYRRFADTVWEIVAGVNEELIDKMKEDDIMCQALMRIMKPEFDAAVEAAVEEAVSKVKESAFNDGIDDKGIRIFVNMMKRGFSRDDAQAMAEISDELVSKALEMC